MDTKAIIIIKQNYTFSQRAKKIVFARGASGRHTDDNSKWAKTTSSTCSGGITRLKNFPFSLIILPHANKVGTDLPTVTFLE